MPEPAEDKESAAGWPAGIKHLHMEQAAGSNCLAVITPEMHQTYKRRQWHLKVIVHNYFAVFGYVVDMTQTSSTQRKKPAPIRLPPPGR